MPNAQPGRVPVSTYRLQVHAGFPFENVRQVVPYLARLGVTEIYSSPLLMARPGSTHCYDVCDHTRLNPEFGSEDDFAKLSEELRSHNLGLIVDFVPNHVSVDPSANLWWRSVLENGPSSPYAHFFDIDWDPVKSELKSKLLFPILGDQYGDVIDRGELRIEFRDGAFSLLYWDRNLPLNPRQLPKLLRHNLHVLESELDPNDPHLQEFLSILFQLDHIPLYTETDPDLIVDRGREKEIARERLARLVDADERIRRHVERIVAEFNGQPGRPESFNLLHDLLESQPYRLAYWRTALHEINYRRFFDINELGGLRMEDPRVFEATHALLRKLVQSGQVTGLRLDHVDGLFDPTGYFDRLAECFGDRPLYTVVEKILSGSETLRTDWKVHGTTGYEFLNDVNGLFVDGRNEQIIKKTAARFTGNDDLFSDVIYESKKLIIMVSMVSELNVLAHQLNRISESNRRYRDFTLSSFQEALREIVACFPVYRAYFRAGGWSEFDEKSIDTAIERALRRNPAMESSIFRFIRRMLLPVLEDGITEAEYQRRVDFAMKFQQYTGPVQAKGLEDTAFYRHAPLLSVNEVGGDPYRFARSPEDFHYANTQRLEHWPLSMLTTATHDTKRGEDARARLNVLSEFAEQWRDAVRRWARINAGQKTLVHTTAAPDRHDEYLYYQALLGAWPPELDGTPDAPFIDRMIEYMRKAIKEAKVHTSWVNPSEDYDAAVTNFVRHTLGGRHGQRFLDVFLPFQKQIAWFGMLNALSQIVLKATAPGVPDFYQGCELWDFSLVDPDNRRPVDFALRSRMLDELEPLLQASDEAGSILAALQGMVDNWHDGKVKLYVTARLLRLRRDWSHVFPSGRYLPLRPTGAQADRVVAFARSFGNQAAVVVAPRLMAGLLGFKKAVPTGLVWEDTAIPLPADLPATRYRNLFTRETISCRTANTTAELALADVLRSFPVAVLLAENGATGGPGQETPS